MTSRRTLLYATLAAFAAPLVPAPWRRAYAQGKPAQPAPAAGLFAVEFRTGANWNRELPAHEQPGFGEHSANLRRLREQGKLVVGARYGDTGLVVLSADSEAQARAWIEADASVRNGVFAYELHAMRVFYPGCLGAAAGAT